ncbi:MAG: hypothetical protein PHO56_00970 [Patescibacteria group bacterium]|nr:hypothetical protein [Patescibacteria group bacterium]
MRRLSMDEKFYLIAIVVCAIAIFAVANWDKIIPAHSEQTPTEQLISLVKRGVATYERDVANEAARR